MYADSILADHFLNLNVGEAVSVRGTGASNPIIKDIKAHNTFERKKYF